MPLHTLHTPHTLRPYATNAPEAAARVLTMMMLSDMRLSDEELEALDRLGAYEILGLSKRAFSDVFQAYCEDLRTADAPGGRLPLIDRDRVDQVLDAVTDPQRRIALARLMVCLAKADGRLCDAESTVLGYALTRWRIGIDALGA